MRIQLGRALTVAAATLAVSVIPALSGASAVADPVAAAPYPSCDYGQTSYPTLGIGSRGPVVKHAQCLINRVTYMQLTVDGIYGSGTETGVKHFQANAGLAVDGILGPDTWDALHNW
ncbi:peptidoglycan hydrolase-like protein with peptidoglycan-binding domain [Saccharopolyspora lacisalsi]|uniref:Peptidoglycan hydrolase-like protein with peptidoglycan-binding domain n=1 Tax=Halosaccharopolyspora lacisalsi TaxID=1000566 RepID=A0A839DQT4_9PSEU|nr:peptidoglycan-binding domain-containing protein [Halosaccharopolyspora lacisalsi]MBA8824342.1 peptidoglycan hydrolase-like protein with peptidoglycan-binding domain [Halosaccharopolyspora lacisalsi]